MADSALDDVLNQLRDHGLEPITSKRDLVFGKLTRCRAGKDAVGEKNGWYVLHEYRTEKGDLLYFGAFGDWRTGESNKIKVKGPRMTAEERELMNSRQEEAKRKAAETQLHAARRAAKRAQGMWEKLPEKGRSPYLDRKQIVGLGVRYSAKGAVLVPMKTVRGIVGLQVIHPAKQENGRDKQYWPYGMEKQGAYHLVGPHPEPGEAILVCEGYATGMSLNMATSCCVAIAFDSGNLLPVAKAMRQQYPGRPLIMCADDDWKTTRADKVTPWNVGVEKASNAAEILGGQVVAPVFTVERDDKWTDWNDLHCHEGLDAVRRQVMALVRPPADGGWHDMLHRTQTGGLSGHMINVSLILGNDERWKGTLGYNAFSSKTVALRTPPFGSRSGEWADLDDMLTTEWLAQQYGLLVKSATVLEAVSVTASKNTFHPVRDYLNGLTWDRTARIESWLYLVMGVPLSQYSMKVAKRWLIGAVARVMNPGAKVDNVLILEGGQGEGKSTALSILGGEWFMDTPFTLGDKEAFQMIRGKWIVELGELDSFNKADSTKAKQFFSASTDTFRESYGRRTADVPRQCVFAGTTNQEEYLKDTTGNRRYWPVMCEKVDLEALRGIRDQLWAEALFCYQAGDIWWVRKEESQTFADEQDARYTVDAWEHQILPFLEDYVGETVTSADILTDALKLDLGHWGKPEQMRVGSIMHRLGWRRTRLASTGKSNIRPWGYRRPADWRRAAEVPALAGDKGMPF